MIREDGDEDIVNEPISRNVLQAEDYESYKLRLLAMAIDADVGPSADFEREVLDIQPHFHVVEFTADETPASKK